MQPSFANGARNSFQTAAVISILILFGFSGFAFTFLSFYILFYTKYYYAILLYFLWLWWDRKQCVRGGRRFNWIRHWKLWIYFRDYFPIRLIKTADLDPNKNYLCGYHPHGMFCVGFVTSFATEAVSFSKIFPFIKPSILLLLAQFWFPIHRELVLALGACTVSRESIEWLLTQAGKGNMLIIVVGGSAEMLNAHPGTVKLNLKSRKGFVRLAIKKGASLVPIFAFGENEVFEQIPNPKGSLLRKVQDFFYDNYRLSIPILSFRGWIPSRQPIDVIVGKPIDVTQNPQPTEKDVDQYHKLYMDSLVRLFNEHKKNYENYKNVNIEL